MPILRVGMQPAPMDGKPNGFDRQSAQPVFSASSDASLQVPLLSVVEHLDVGSQAFPGRVQGEQMGTVSAVAIARRPLAIQLRRKPARMGIGAIIAGVPRKWGPAGPP